MAIFGESTFANEGAASPTTQQMFLSGGTAPEAGTMESVSIRVAGSGAAANAYIGIYSGGTSGDPAGATLIATTANITGSYTTTALQTFALSAAGGGRLTFSASELLWVAVLCVSDSDRFDYRICDDNGHWGNGQNGWMYTGTGHTSLPATMPSTTGYVSQVKAAYVTYTTGAAFKSAWARNSNQVIA